MVSLERNLGILTLKSLYAFHYAMTSVCSSGGFSLPHSREMADGLESEDTVSAHASWSISRTRDLPEMYSRGMKPGKGGSALSSSGGTSQHEPPVPYFHHRCGLGGRPRPLPSEKPGLCPLSLSPFMGQTGRALPRFTSALKPWIGFYEFIWVPEITGHLGGSDKGCGPAPWKTM